MPRRTALALSACLLAGFATLLDQAVVTYTVPSLSADLEPGTGAVQWFLAVYSLTFGLGLVPAGRLGDAHGRRGLFVIGLAVFFGGAVVTVLAPDMGWAIAGRCIQGLGAGAVSAQVLGIIQDLFVGPARLRALAAYSIAAACAAIVGPLAAGLVLIAVPEGVAWRVILTISLPFIAVTAVLALRFTPSSVRAQGRARLDLPGILLTAGVVFLATVPVVDPGLRGAPRWIAFIGIAGCLGALIGWERHLGAKGGNPLFAPSLMRSAGFVSGNVTALLWFGSVVGQSAIVTVFLLQSYHLAGIVVALVLIPGSVARIVGSSLSSRIDAVIRGWTMPACLALQLASVSALVIVTGSVSGLGLLVAVLSIEIALGFASGAFEPPMRARTLAFALPGEYGLAASLLQLTQRMSATLCVALVTGVAFASGISSVDAGGLRAGLVVCALLIALSLVESVRASVFVHRPTVLAGRGL